MTYTEYIKDNDISIEDERYSEAKLRFEACASGFYNIDLSVDYDGEYTGSGLLYWAMYEEGGYDEREK